MSEFQKKTYQKLVYKYKVDDSPLDNVYQMVWNITSSRMSWGPTLCGLRIVFSKYLFKKKMKH